MTDDTSLLVRATTMNFYGGVRVRPGQTFTLTEREHFNPKSMAWVGEPAKDDIATAEAASPRRVEAAHVKPKLTRATGNVRSAVHPATDDGI